MDLEMADAPILDSPQMANKAPPQTNGIDQFALRSPPPTEADAATTSPGPSSTAPRRQAAESPDLSPADEGSNHQGTNPNSKGIDIPKQPDTPDSTQQLTLEEIAKPRDSSTGDAATKVGQVGDNTKPTANNESGQKPVMHIDIGGPLSKTPAGLVASPAPLTGTVTTPRRPAPPTPSAQDSSKRATRISSGVLQKKSVSEILNEAQRSSSQANSPGFDAREAGGTLDRRDKERSKLTTVVFSKPQKENDVEGNEITVLDPDSPAKVTQRERDYLYTLFENKAHSMTKNGSMSYLIQNAHKTLSTADHLVDYQMQTDCRILKRVYQLQERGRWSLRQHKRAEEAPRTTSHWDILLDHAKWMRTDFREERKWKLAAARGLAEECAYWAQCSPDQRKELQVKTRPPRFLSEHGDTGSTDVDMGGAQEEQPSSHPTPELIPSNEDDSMSDDLPDPRIVNTSISPAAIFSLGASEFAFQVDKTPAFDKLLNELPLYEPEAIVPDYANSDLAQRLDARWKTDIVPVSRFAVEKLEVEDEKPRRKKSRYAYDLEMSPTRRDDIMPPREQNVALFMQENQHIRERIHPGHSFRPPSEYPMPTQDFFQTRSSSQWTPAEDDELKRLVKDYSYNWSLISSCLTPRSLYASGADRRTPWECFERWIGMEGLPSEMSKTPYFKTYSSRIEAAGKYVVAQIEEAQRRAGTNVQIPARKRTTQPVRVERKRTQRHLAMLDAMRKNAKKRENAAQKQQHQSDIAAMRKLNSNEINQPKAPFKTPREFAALRQERDAKRAEQQEIYRQQLLAHQRANQQAQHGQPTPVNGIPNGLPNGAPGMRMPPGNMPRMPNNMPMPPNGVRPHPAVMAAMNGMQGPQGMAQKMTPAQMQARGIAASPEQIRMMQQASKVQQQQQELMRQAQQNGQHSSPNGPHASLVNGSSSYNMPNANGAPSPHGNASSPRSQNSTSGQLSSGHIPVLNQIANKIKQHNPQMSDEDVQKLATNQITMWQQQAAAAAVNQTHKRPAPQNQAALNAAVGAMNSAAHASNNAIAANFAQQNQGLTPEQMQQYQAQRMRMMQAAQAQAQQQGVAGRQGQQSSPAMHNMNMAGGLPMNSAQGAMAANSPVMSMARPVSQGGPRPTSRSGTPNVRDARSGSMSGPGAGSPGPQQQHQRPGSSRAMVGTPQSLSAQPISAPAPAPAPQQQAQVAGQGQSAS
jgi:chromatin modification-related protein VID21